MSGFLLSDQTGDVPSGASYDETLSMYPLTLAECWAVCEYAGLLLFALDSRAFTYAPDSEKSCPLERAYIKWQCLRPTE